MFLGLASLSFVSWDPEFRIFSKQDVKKAKSSKIYFSRTVSVTGKQKAVSLSLMGPLSSFSIITPAF
jgi:hypothetical protein